MRRADREITDPVKIEQFLAGEKIMRIAFFDDGDIYIVPVNYGMYTENGSYRFYFHGAMAGRKYDLAKARPSVGFETDGKMRLLRSEKACDHSVEYQSVIGTGILSIVDDPKEKKLGLDCIMKQQTAKDDWDYSDEIMSHSAVFRLDVKKLSCKAK